MEGVGELRTSSYALRSGAVQQEESEVSRNGESSTVAGESQERCRRCGRATRRYRPIVCAGCSGRFHAQCSGVRRGLWARMRESNEWRCDGCVGLVREETSRASPVVEAEDVQEASVDVRMEELKDRVRRGERCCKEGCGGRVRLAGVQVCCGRCDGMFHFSCAGVSRVQLLGEVRRGEWRCRRCEVQVREENRTEAGESGVSGDRREGGWERVGKRSLRVLQWNADGMNTKKAELEVLSWRLDINMAVIQETKLGEGQRMPVFRGFYRDQEG